MKILSVIGARPNFMKITPIAAAIDRYNRQCGKTAKSIRHILVHTGQHYDELMSGIFFEDLGLPTPDIYLGIGSASHAVQTANLLIQFEKVLLEHTPDIVLVVGDVNSTIACALATSKFYINEGRKRPLIAHVEAGLRSFDHTMPEEINRILTDHISDILLVTESSGMNNLKREGLPRSKQYFVGNTMIDTLLTFKKASQQSPILSQLGLISEKRGRRSLLSPYALLTMHRPSNVDNKKTLCGIVDALRTVSKVMPVIFPCHPRTRNKLSEFKMNNYFSCLNVRNVLCKNASADRAISKRSDQLYLIDPLGYIDFLQLMSNARVVFTDSGGIQEETTCLHIPCITLRNNTERPVTISNGTNVLGGTTKKEIVKAFEHSMKKTLNNRRKPKYWDGRASERILKILLQAHNKKMNS